MIEVKISNHVYDHLVRRWEPPDPIDFHVNSTRKTGHGGMLFFVRMSMKGMRYIEEQCVLLSQDSANLTELERKQARDLAIKLGRLIEMRED